MKQGEINPRRQRLQGPAELAGQAGGLQKDALEFFEDR
jgi:hypothetical protein